MMHKYHISDNMSLISAQGASGSSFCREILKVNRAHLAELHKPIDIHCPAVETDEGVAEIWICRTLERAKE